MKPQTFRLALLLGVLASVASAGLLFGMRFEPTAETRFSLDDPLDETVVITSDKSEIVGFRIQQEQLVSVSRNGTLNRYEVSGLAEDLAVSSVYDWIIREKSTTLLLLGVSTRHDAEPAATLFVARGENRLQRIGEDAVDAVFSPDGSSVAFTTSNFDVVVTDLAGEQRAVLRDAGTPQWHDSETLIITHAVEGVGSDSSSNMELLLVSRDGTKLRTLLPSSLDVSRPTFLPSRKSVVFVGGKTGIASFYKLDLHTGTVIQLTNVGHTNIRSDTVPVSARRGRWSPDGSQYAFDVRHRGISETWLLNMQEDSVSAVRLSVGAEPVWLESGVLAIVSGRPVSEQRVVNTQP